jgi:surfeit locus 1 family protein
MRRFRPRPLPTLVALIAFVILASLGTWQVERLQWKTDLLRTIEERTAAEPVPLDALPAEDPAALAWSRVRATGRFLPRPGPPELYGVETRDGVLGSHLLGAFETEGGRVMMVDRGFTPEASTPPPVPEGQVEVEAILRDRSADRQTWFQPDNDPATGHWFWIDLGALGRIFQRPLDPLALQLMPGSPGATPQAAPPRIDLPNNHLGYAITWYGLALALLLVYFAFSSERTDPTS